MKQIIFTSRFVTTILTLFTVIIIPLSNGCRAPDQNTTGRVETQKKAEQPYLPGPELIDIQVAGNIEFALDLQRVLYNPAHNLFYSPWSISQALAMTFAGARSETEQQMAATLHFTLPQEQLHPVFHALEQALTADSGHDRSAFRLQITDALWAQLDFPILASYLSVTTPNYNAPLRAVDFREREETRQLINRWGSDQTDGRIKELVPRGLINGETALVLTSAVYFNAAWKTPFRKQNRYQGSFQLLDGREVTVPMMPQLALLGYHKEPDVQIIELPYAGERYAMVLLLPTVGTFERFVQELEPSRLSALLAGLKPTGIGLDLPSFSMNSNYLLKEALQHLGMVEAFSEADFSGISGTRELFIRDVCHSSFISVDEEGTEATAGSAVIIERKGGGPRLEVSVTVASPFIYLIRDNATGTILFLGQLLDPTQQ
ncbi:MAG: serpin family protein [Candidatus Delongbacteria bacterium]|nr:serpin family protein [Candidatus Delongbacteria bacterium]